MRLLQRQADGKYSLTKVSPNTHRYAILSHTWEEDEEVTFEDVTQYRGLNKKGYQKLEFCARQAADDGIPYFWVDSCCINKSDNSEFSEAINSMFRWYQQSAKCYVYLADVSKGTDGKTDELSRSTWKHSFRQSRWFSRGWTLQELIAPASVEFFSREGQRLGDKRSLEQSLIDITNIPESALRGSSLVQFSIDERMSWAKGRTTTREEDIAYCLFGIFGISLPPIYGEGAQSARSRLREKISGVPEPLSKVLAELPIAHGATFDSHAEEHNPTCLRDTRVDLLRKIDEWIQSPNAKAMFWLNGMAGTGKSTISRTLAQTASASGCLGATFFFKRGEGDRGGVSKFFSTLAAQLCSREPAVIPHIQAAIDSDPAIFGKAMREQIEKLIFQPLSKISGAADKDRALLIVVDALDECEHEEDVKRFIHLFSNSKSIQSPRLKIFLTSRPDLPMHLGFTAIKEEYQHFILHKVATSVIEHDIQVFFNSELTRVKNDYNASVAEDRHIPAVWPSEDDMRILVKMAVPLFIFAATVCRFVADRRLGVPADQLQEIISYRATAQVSQLDATYMPNFLGAAISIPDSSEQPIRLLHPSFRDFLLDPENRENNQFWIDGKEVHRRLATECLRVMNSSLLTDICQVQAPGTALSEIDPERIKEHLQPEIQYACRYWVYHLEHSGTQLSDSDELYNFLTRHFLHWLEALSLIHRVSESLAILATIRSLTSSPAKQLDAFFDDANRFILTNVSIIQVAPLQVYSSGLLFAPKQSVIRTTFQDLIPQWILREPVVDDKWNNCRQTLEGHSNDVNSVTFSPNGQLVASASKDGTVKVWNAVTGAEQQTLDGHGDCVNLVAFSPNGRLVASASNDKATAGPIWSVVFSHNSQLVASASGDKTVKLWNAETGEQVRTLKGHDKRVNSVAFSPNGKLVASASNDGTVKLWNAETGEQVRTIKGHGGRANSVAFSPDGKLVASASGDQKVKLWDVETGEQVRTIKGHGRRVNSVAFSSDGKLVASASDDKTVKLWDAARGKEVQTFEGHGYRVNSVAFSPDGKLVASASDDKMVKLWDATTGQKRLKPEGHGVASASGDKTVKLWDASTGEEGQTFKGHTESVWSVAFSPNGLIVASASRDKMVKLWDAKIGKVVQTLKGHSSSVNSVAFSPDGKLVVSASWDKTVKVWEVQTGQELQTTYIGTTSSTLSFSADSSSILTDLGAIPVGSQPSQPSPPPRKIARLGYEAAWQLSPYQFYNFISPYNGGLHDEPGLPI
ncbi:WD40-repeat-containing domain protein [Apiospora arundinis]